MSTRVPRSLAPLVLAIASTSHADLVGTSFEIVDLGAPEGTTTYRLYAVFDAPENELLAVEANPHLAYFFRTNTVLVNDPDGAFAGLKQEDLAGSPLMAEWDSWITIRHEQFAGNDTNYSDNFCGDSCSAGPPEVSGSEWYSLGSWFDGNPGTPALPDEDGRILIANFTTEDTASGTAASLVLQGALSWREKGGAEYELTPYRIVIAPRCAADLDDSGAVDFADLFVLLEAWGECDPCAADLDLDDDVDFQDLLRLLVSWGACD